MRRTARLRLRLLVTSTLICVVARGQSAAEFIHQLTNPPDRQGIFGCGMVVQAESEARALAELKDAAVPALENALDSIETDGDRSTFRANASLLLLAYAKIKGIDAVARIDRIAQKNSEFKIGSYWIDVDSAYALAFGLTGYVSRFHAPDGLITCHGPRPSDSLEQLIRAWMRDDVQRFDWQLAPAAVSSLRSSLVTRSWEQFRQSFVPARLGGEAAVGIRLEANGGRAEPPVTLMPSRTAIDGSVDLISPELAVHFTNRWGRDCGQEKVAFVGTWQGKGISKPPPLPSTYQVNNVRLEDLLRVISVCAADDAR